MHSLAARLKTVGSISHWKRIGRIGLRTVGSTAAGRQRGQVNVEKLGKSLSGQESSKIVQFTTHPCKFDLEEAPQYGFTNGNYQFLRFYFMQLKKCDNNGSNEQQSVMKIVNNVLQTVLQSLQENQDKLHLIVGFTPQLWNDLATYNLGANGTDFGVSYPGSDTSCMNDPKLAKLNNGSLQFNQKSEDYWIWVQMRSDKSSNAMFNAAGTLTSALNKIVNDSGDLVLNKEVNSKPIDCVQNKSGMVLDHFQDGYSNGTSKAQLKTSILNEDGSSFGLFQLFRVKYGEFSQQQESAMEKIIGRTMAGELRGGFPRCAHNRRNRIIDPIDKLPVSLFRVAGTTVDSNYESGSDQEIAFSAFASDISKIETHLLNMLGRGKPESKDDLLNQLQNNHGGGYFYIPGANHLYQVCNANASNMVYDEYMPEPAQQFTGMGKSNHSKYLFFSSREYMYRMSSYHRHEENDDEFKAPSYRVLKLLGNLFDRWHNSWYYRLVNNEIEPLSFWLEHLSAIDETYKQYNEDNKKNKLTIRERKGLADKILLSNVYSLQTPVSPKDVSIENYDDMDLMASFRVGQDTTVMERSAIETAMKTDVFRLDAYDLLAGVMPDFGLGRGKRSMPYLYDGNERQESFEAGVNENGEGGHIVPSYEKLLAIGIDGMIQELKEKETNATNEESKQFFKAMQHSWEGVSQYFENYGNLAKFMVDNSNNYYNLNEQEAENLLNVSKNCQKMAHKKPDTFYEATQLIFGVHCCLHLLGDLVSIGRLDKLLGSFYENDVKQGTLSFDSAQELIDCFWIKLSEKALLNHEKVKEYQTFGTTAITGRGGNFDQGGGLNQWVQQVTIGGDVWNHVTMMCLRASRRLPLNAPCLSLRLQDGMKSLPDAEPIINMNYSEDDVDASNTAANKANDNKIRSFILDDYLDEAAKAILSGGAHPILFNDTRMKESLTDSVKYSNYYSLDEFKKDVNDWVCDGCYEPLIAGKTHFWFTYIWPLMAVEYALNEGCDFMGAGSEHLTGNKMSLATSPCEEWYEEGEKGWYKFCQLYQLHMEQLIINGYFGALSTFGNVDKFCPSPMLSSMVDGCIDSELEYTNNGAKYNILGLFYQGLSTFIDSMYAIKVLTFDTERRKGSSDLYFEDAAELRDCLKCNWGENMIEPVSFTKERANQDVIEMQLKWQRMRERALALTRFGMGWPGNGEQNLVDKLGNELVSQLCDWSQAIKQNPEKYSQRLKSKMDELNNKYDKKGFDMIVMPGCGNFEGYIGTGGATGASADGRLAGGSYASDLSAAPIPGDLNAIPVRYSDPLPKIPNSHFNREMHNLYSWNQEAFTKKLSNVAPCDVNIRENLDLTQLKNMINEFSKKDSMFGPNLLTLTCANPDTYVRAQNATDSCDLLRVRQGGWSEHFCVLWDAHKNQHQRRPYFDLDENVAAVRYLYDQNKPKLGTQMSYANNATKHKKRHLVL